ncbi:MAG TPA: TolC family protein, partial [Candidatus Binataceae bacterium]|nr:TolC family protein [Candidatus Binataceae bacterium]
LANARLLVHDAEARMAIALGIAANELPPVQGLGNLLIPQSLNASVDALIDETRRQRPDLAARDAHLRETASQVQNARSQFFPVLGLSASYGENAWNFKFSTPQTTQTAQPQYLALLTLKWDIFTGFGRINEVRRAEDEREAARAELGSLEIDAVAQVWRAYYEYQSSLSKYSFARSLIAASQEAYDANIETYRQGLSTIVELLTAERDLANARYTLIQSKAELLTAYAEVAYAAGQTRLP